MDQKLIDEINSKTQILDVVSEFVDLQKRGKNYMGLCPFHDEKTPSFSVSPEKNICKCMGCGEGGNPINFYRKIKNISLQEAAEVLAERAGIEIKKTVVKKNPNEKLFKMMEEASTFYQFNLKNSKAGEEAYDYLIKRELSPKTIDHFKLGYAPSFGDTLYQVLKDKGYAVSDMIKLGIVKQNNDGKYYDLFSDRVIFPVTDPEGRVVGFSGRTLSSKDQVKYINSPETVIFKKGFLLYHLYESLSDIRKTKQIILFEGFFDVISSYQAGITNGVATMGTALTKNQAQLMRKYSPSVVVAYDGDSAGLKATDHAIPLLEQTGIKTEVLVIPDKMDPDEFIKNYGPERYETLYGEFVVDPYQFRFDYYRQGLDLKNTNDVKLFKTRVTKMLVGADPAIIAIYKNRLAKTLHIDESDIVVKKERIAPTIPPKPIDIEIKRNIIDKYEKAERLLIIVMLRSKADSRYVTSMLSTNDYADPIVSSIRLKIQDYYLDHDIIDIDDFKDHLTHDQRSYFEKYIMTDLFYEKEIEIPRSSYHPYIDLLKNTASKRRLEYLKSMMTEDGFEDKNLELEYHTLVSKMKINGGNNGH
ncbi:MAG: DNA primase [Acholeplasmataceae bacterium]